MQGSIHILLHRKIKCLRLTGGLQLELLMFRGKRRSVIKSFLKITQLLQGKTEQEDNIESLCSPSFEVEERLSCNCDIFSKSWEIQKASVQRKMSGQYVISTPYETS